MNENQCKAEGGKIVDGKCVYPGKKKPYIKNKNMAYVVWAVCLLLLGGGGYWFYTTQLSGTGILELRLTDAPPTQAITSLILEISGIRVHYTGSNETQAGWIDVKNGPMTFDVIKLIGDDALLGKERLEPGLYTQIRLMIDKATMTLADGSEHNVEIPSGEIKLISEFEIKDGKKLIINLDFDAKNSIQVKETANGYLLRPTIKVIYENVDCTANEDCVGYDSTMTCGNMVSCKEKVCSMDYLECPAG